MLRSREHAEIMAALEQEAREQGSPLDPGPYRIENGRICVELMKEHGPVLKPLCNFTARVAEELVLDDGAETTRAFILEGQLEGGERLPPVRVPATRFGGMSWVPDLWGFRAVVNAGVATRDQLREAIQRLSPNPRRRQVFAHTGWREIGGQWVYLTAGGAVGCDGCEVDLGPELARYSLPQTPDDPRGALRLSLRLLEIAPLTVTAPLWAAVFLAPLASVFPVDLSLWLLGVTGSLKSTLAALFLSHYGEFDRTSLPGSWSSTVNQLERRAFILKDLVFVVDDYAPTAFDARELEMKASRLLRSQGNLCGRGRLRADLTERPAYPPRGIIIGTGEQSPQGQSVLVRTLLVGMDRSSVDLAALTEAQRASARLRHALAGYVEWLRPQISDLRTMLPEAFAGARQRATGADEHLRVPEVLAHLWIGMDCGLRYAEEVGACSSGEAEARRRECWQALLGLGRTQAHSIEGERPTRRFLEVVATLLAQGQVEVFPKEVSPASRHSHSVLIGWYDEDSIYLLPDAAFQAVARFCRDSGEPYPVRQERLLRELNREGLSECAAGRNTTTARLGGQLRRVVRLRRPQVEELLGEQLPAPVTTVTNVTGSGE